MSALRDLSTPSMVVSRLEAIENDLAIRQNELEDAAMLWFQEKRDQEHRYAEEFIKAEGTVAERTAQAKLETAMVGKDSEAAYEALKAVCRVLDTRAAIGMAILKSQGRAGS